MKLNIGTDEHSATQSAVFFWTIVEGDGAKEPSLAGYEYGTSIAFGSRVTADISGIYFSKNISGLTAGREYYVRAFAVIDGKTWYSETVSVKTESSGAGAVSGARYTFSDCCEFPATNVAEGTTTTSGYNSSYGDRWYATSTKTAGQTVVTHTFNDGGFVRNYSMLYDAGKKCALWTACAFNSTTWKDANVGRNEKWGADPALPESDQPRLGSSYTGNYSRGHQIASGDRQTTKQQNTQAFYYSNMTPQNQTLNGGNWAQLENAVQSHGNATSGRDTLYMVTGPIFDSGYSSTSDKSGTKCPVPSRYYKCLMKCSFNAAGEVTVAKGVAYLTTGNNASANTAYSNWVTTIDEIESITGFDFFTNVPKSLQDAAEASRTPLF